MTGHLSEDELARIARGGMTALTADDGLALLDLALTGTTRCWWRPGWIWPACVRWAARGLGDVAALWRGLVGGSRRPDGGDRRGHRW